MEKVKDYPRQESYALCRCGILTINLFVMGFIPKQGLAARKLSRKVLRNLLRKLRAMILFYMMFMNCVLVLVCDRKTGIWNLIKDKKNNEIVKQEAFDCPSGRLVIHDRMAKLSRSSIKKSVLLNILEKDVRGLCG